MKSKWIDKRYYIFCENCGEEALYTDVYDDDKERVVYDKVKTKFCPHCGAEMENYETGLYCG